MTEGQIERYIPKTASERKQYVEDRKNDFETMKRDIAYLLSEVSELRATAAKGSAVEGHSGGGHAGNGGGGGGSGGGGSLLARMDGVHAEKRRQHEEELLKSHPDFKPGKRLWDTVDTSGVAKSQ